MDLKKIFSTIIIINMLSCPSLVLSKEEPFNIIIKDHQFSPLELIIPANQKIKIIVENQDSTVEEFESYELNREKIVGGNSKVILFIGPLKPGAYKYFGEFHPKTAQGVIIAR